MLVHELSSTHSILNNYLFELRDTQQQKDPLRFRQNLIRIGRIMGYEISKSLQYQPTECTTPLGVSQENLISEQVVLGTVFRAGLPLHQGLLETFDRAENAFISAFRKEEDGPEKPEEFEVEVEYIACPPLEGKSLILADTMLATGASLITVMKAFEKHGSPDHIHLACVIGSEEGVEKIRSSFGDNCTLWIAKIDPSLNEKGYIVPGLGDAGDLAYGEKVSY